MPYAPSASLGFSPLDDELQLLPGGLTPALEESLVHLGTWMPFVRAMKELRFFNHVHIPEATVRRDTEAAGAAYVAVQTAEVERLEQTAPAPPEGPAIQLLSVDGAMVPLVHHEWAEVKTLVLGVVQPPVIEKGEPVVHSTALSYFSRLADAETFGHLALVETHRRGTETAKQVCAVMDGAEWEQGFVDLHRRDATRILDFSHGAGYVANAGDAVYGEGTATNQSWLKETLQELKHGSPDTVLTTLREMHRQAQACGPGDGATVTTLETSLGYLEKRRAQIDYARFQQLGYPIGSGSVESGNKLVVEARLKGSGMHWARPHVDPLLALRNIACSDRWDEAWPQITEQLRRHARTAQLQRYQQRRAQRTASTPVSERVVIPVAGLVIPESDGAVLDPPDSERVVIPVVVAPQKTAPASPPAASSSLKRPDDSLPVTTKPYRPPVNHPWRHSPIGQARFKSTRRSGNAKL